MSECIKLLVSSTGGVLVQRRTNGSSHNGRLCVPWLGSGSGLAHGAVFDGAYPRIHDLYVYRAQGDLQRGEKGNLSSSLFVVDL